VHDVAAEDVAGVAVGRAAGYDLDIEEQLGKIRAALYGDGKASPAASLCGEGGFLLRSERVSIRSV
jgi:hypothetical protein